MNCPTNNVEGYLLLDTNVYVSRISEEEQGNNT